MANAGGNGYGRGGRGAALLAALRQPVRRPGDQESQTPPPPPQPQTLSQQATVSSPTLDLLERSVSNVSLETGPSPTPMGRGVTAAVGRGAYLKSLLSAASSQGSGPSQASDAGSVGRGITPPVGRGSAAMSDTSSLSGHGVSSSPAPTTGSSADTRTPISMRGNSGTEANLSSNYIRVKCRNRYMYQYAVAFKPEVDSRNMRYKMVNQLREVIGPVKAFDGTVLVLPKKLALVENVMKVKRPTDDADIQVVIKLTKELSPGENECVKVYNVIFKRIMSILKLNPVGRKYYDPSNPSYIPQHKLEIWPGYVTAIKEHEDGLMLLADVSHRVIRRETVLEVMATAIHKSPRNFRDDIMKLLVGATVLTRYNNRTYRIDDVDWAMNPNSTFMSSDGSAIKFKDYYKTHYGKEIQDDQQPMLIHRPRAKLTTVKGQSGPVREQETICLVPELCYMSGLTDDMRSDFKVMKDISQHTKVAPEARRQAMLKFAHNVMTTPEAKEQLDNWGLALDSDIVKVPGRALPPEKIIMGLNRIVSAGPKADWTQDALRSPQLMGVKIHHWIVVCTRRDCGTVNNFLAQLGQLTRTLGIHMNPPRLVDIQDERTDTYIRAIRENFTPNQTQLVMAVMPTRRDDRYNAFKKLCCVDMPVPSQALQTRTINDPKKLRSVASKILIQVNCKLGGEPWGVDIPLKNIMVVGIDSYHEKNKSSVGAFVASISSNVTRYYSRPVFQAQGQELIDGLKPCMISALKKYHEVNGSLPEKIIVYRDGVGDGQLKQVSNYEVSQLADCFKTFGDYDPRLIVVVVQKKINTRIFGHEVQTPRLTNPQPGTIVDSTITRPDWYDFFIVSQSVREGTVTPTHYIVVHDSSSLKPDHLQRLTYKMCHLYYNWTGTIRVPAPCQYAHKLAYLTGENIRKTPSTDLSDRLFYL